MERRHADRPGFAIFIMIVAVAMLVAMNTLVKIIGSEYHAFSVVIGCNIVTAFALITFVDYVRAQGRRNTIAADAATGTSVVVFDNRRHRRLLFLLRRAAASDRRRHGDLTGRTIVRDSHCRSGTRGTCRLAALERVRVRALRRHSGARARRRSVVRCTGRGARTALWSITILAVRSLCANDSPAATTF
jgi:hypothetical protein